MTVTEKQCRTVQLKLYPVDIDYERDGYAEFAVPRKEFPRLNRGDIVVVYNNEKNTRRFPRLLAEITQIGDDSTIPRDAVSLTIEKPSLVYFGLRNYSQVVVAEIDLQEVALDLCEVRFKEQYVSRSDMWRMKRYMLKDARCVYLEKQIKFCDIRCHVGELWHGGETVACGVITENTRMVFRSCSAKVCLFIQMSQEMWNWDTQGDLYFEKCVTGFLPELFEKFRKERCSHYVTVVLFSRWFYNARSLNSFPEAVRGDVLMDYKGRYYQDFYRLIVQNELYDDWQPVITRLKPLLNDYSDITKSYIESMGNGHSRMPKARNSTAMDGNFLETINMSLNVFVKHHMDRNFERTGQMNIVITPGGGVFAVDRKFANLTKQRVIDEGISLDLVCLGEQPLHAVPLFMFHNKNGITRNDYNIPHWMNYSYYNPLRYGNPYGNFMPRINLPDCLRDNPNPMIQMAHLDVPVDPITQCIDFDQWDREMFLPRSKAKKLSAAEKLQKKRRTRFTSHHDGMLSSCYLDRRHSSQVFSNGSTDSGHKGSSDRNNSSGFVGRIGEKHSEAKDIDATELSDRPIVGSAGAESTSAHPMESQQRTNTHPPLSPKQSLFNPFKPAEYSVKITANRRRWIHVFPTDAKGMAKQAHHFVSGTSVFYVSTEDQPLLPNAHARGSGSIASSGQLMDEESSEADAAFISSDADSVASSPRHDHIGVHHTRSDSRGEGSGKNKNLVWAWGVTGEEQWNPDMLIGIDWKALALPAILPITTDYFPDSRSLRNGYFFSEHSIDEYVEETWKGSTPEDIFNELICQRLQQGFQITTLDKEMLHSATMALMGPAFNARPFTRECYMSINRIYHRLTLSGNAIWVTKFTPRHLYPLEDVSYSYQFQVPDSATYAPSFTKFRHFPLERFNWSWLDPFIASKGEYEEVVSREKTEGMRFYEARFMLLPRGHPSVPRIKSGESRCDIFENYHEGRNMSMAALLDGYVKFMEAWNRVKRPLGSGRLRIDASKRKASCDAVGSVDTVTVNDDMTSESASAGELLPQWVDTVVTAMTDPVYLFEFLVEETGRVPPKTFIAADLVSWLQHHVAQIYDISGAVTFAQKMVEERRICHVSGDFSCHFEYGFLLFMMVPSTDSSSSFTTSLASKEQWLEARMCDHQPQLQPAKGYCAFRLRSCKIDIQHASTRPDRQEWIWLKHSATFWPAMAFEIGIQFLVATGAIAGDMLRSCCSYALSSLFHLIPVPADPFALPYNANSDPLRCPITIYLNSAKAKEMDDNALKAMQVSILKKFGFISMACEKHRRARQLIHLSGGMFVLIAKPGSFQWSWNYMLGKRYRGYECAADEAFQDRMLADFRRFCADEDLRLSSFITSYLEDNPIFGAPD